MTIKEIYIARHGYRSNWLPPPHPPNPTGIDSDPPLAPHGVEQAKQLAAYLTSLPTIDQPQFIITSPFYRCVETAQPIAKLLDLKIGLERGIGEWFKKDRKIIPEPANYTDLKRFFNDVLVDEKLWPRDQLGVIPNPKGETNIEILERANLFWQKFIPFFEKNYPEIENILLITHAATKIALGSSLLNLESVTSPYDEENTMLRAGACSLSKYIRDNLNDDFSWKLVMNGNCEFLTKGEEMNWDFTINVEAGSAEDILRRKKEAQLKSNEENEGNDNLENSESKSQTEIPVTNIATGTDIAGTKDDEYETFYVTLDLPNNIKKIEEDEGVNKNSRYKKLQRHFNILKPSAKLQISDITAEHPLIKISNNKSINEPDLISKTNKIGNSSNNNHHNLIDYSALLNEKIMETKWNKLIGSELLFDEYGELIGQVKEHLTCVNKVIFEKRKEVVKNNDNMDIDLSNDEDEDGSKSKFKGSTFWKQSIRNAQD
ncbi:TFC7 [Candida jiufengensis]|uniref:TFC7 n=1 Tax=Candida jiufengensis TaxID=497108 RepID=UPI002224C7EA|nr:TFC7 [Candida jiufengensis]KAI5949540.1 TFC7 [Candida jiufengensis]